MPWLRVCNPDYTGHNRVFSTADIFSRQNRLTVTWFTSVLSQ